MSTRTQKLTRLAIIAAIAYVLTVVGRIPITPLDFLKYDPKDAMIVIAGLAYGPLSAIGVSVVVSFIEMITVSSSGIIGFFMNVLSTCMFACTAAVIYKFRHSIAGALVGLIVGTFAMTVLMLFWNYLITPLYMGLPREEVLAILVPIILPFNLIKGGLNTGLTLLIYKPVSKILHPGATSAKTSVKPGVIIAAAVILITCVFFALVMAGVI